MKAGYAQVEAIKSEGLAIIDFVDRRPQPLGIKTVASAFAVNAMAHNLKHLSSDHTAEQIRHVRTLMLGQLREAVAVLEGDA